MEGQVLAVNSAKENAESESPEKQIRIDALQ